MYVRCMCGACVCEVYGVCMRCVSFVRYVRRVYVKCVVRTWRVWCMCMVCEGVWLCEACTYCDVQKMCVSVCGV